jgi:rod shape-determining protein MreB
LHGNRYEVDPVLASRTVQLIYDPYSLGAIVDAVREALEDTPPELAGDMAETGILLAGGSSLLAGFAERLAEDTGMPAQLTRFGRPTEEAATLIAARHTHTRTAPCVERR